MMKTSQATATSFHCATTSAPIVTTPTTPLLSALHLTTYATTT